jgi:hypothetical protein
VQRRVNANGREDAPGREQVEGEPQRSRRADALERANNTGRLDRLTLRESSSDRSQRLADSVYGSG